MYQNVQPIASGGKVASAQLKVITPSSNSKGHVHWLALYNNNAAVRYAMLFDAAALPADGAAPLFMQSMPATSSVPKEIAFPPDGLLFAVGIFICISSTPDVKTIAAADMIFTVGIT